MRYRVCYEGESIEINTYSAKINSNLPEKEYFCSKCGSELKYKMYACLNVNDINTRDHKHLCEDCIPEELMNAINIRRMLELLGK